MILDRPTHLRRFVYAVQSGEMHIAEALQAFAASESAAADAYHRLALDAMNTRLPAPILVCAQCPALHLLKKDVTP